MRQVTETVYKFEELSKEVQCRLVEIFEVPDYWHEYYIDYWKEKLSSLGFIDPDISFDVSCCQGSGTSFTASIDHDLLEVALLYCKCTTYEKAKLAKTGCRMLRVGFLDIGLVRFNHHYSHERTVSVNTEVDTTYQLNSYLVGIINDFTEMVDDFRVELCHAIHSSLEEEYEYCCSKDYIKEYYADDEFYADGRTYYGD